MRKIGFDNELYLRKQSEMIMKRVNEFGGKLYLELGGKLFDDYHASRVLPGFEPDTKLQMLKTLADNILSEIRTYFKYNQLYFVVSFHFPNYKLCCNSEKNKYF